MNIMSQNKSLITFSEEDFKSLNTTKEIFDKIMASMEDNNYEVLLAIDEDENFRMFYFEDIYNFLTMLSVVTNSTLLEIRE